jgi:hypothetical protein
MLLLLILLCCGSYCGWRLLNLLPPPTCDSAAAIMSKYVKQIDKKVERHDGDGAGVGSQR